MSKSAKSDTNMCEVYLLVRVHLYVPTGCGVIKIINLIKDRLCILQLIFAVSIEMWSISSPLDSVPLGFAFINAVQQDYMIQRLGIKSHWTVGFSHRTLPTKPDRIWSMSVLYSQPIIQEDHYTASTPSYY